MPLIKEHYLYGGAIFADPHPYIVSTVLGSCVAVCLYDPVNRMGGINHYQLDLWNGTGLASPKFGNIAIQKLFEKMLKMGSRQSDLQAKIFGGASVIGNSQNLFQIGERNCEIAFSMLKELNIPIIASDVGGNHGRKIKFNTETGIVLMKYVNKK
ncbi:chemotaxis protein CheD [candidate division KSB1 bacterium]|nr:MAG: chemotaxis protein CheD [candidate division KSB1 bacterium]